MCPKISDGSICIQDADHMRGKPKHLPISQSLEIYCTLESKRVSPTTTRNNESCSRAVEHDLDRSLSFYHVSTASTSSSCCSSPEQLRGLSSDTDPYMVGVPDTEDDKSTVSSVGNFTDISGGSPVGPEDDDSSICSYIDDMKDVQVEDLIHDTVLHEDKYKEALYQAENELPAPNELQAANELIRKFRNREHARNSRARADLLRQKLRKENQNLERRSVDQLYRIIHVKKWIDILKEYLSGNAIRSPGENRFLENTHETTPSYPLLTRTGPYVKNHRKKCTQFPRQEKSPIQASELSSTENDYVGILSPWEVASDQIMEQNNRGSKRCPSDGNVSVLQFPEKILM